ncbi:S-layer homology domain-containing protein [Tissierella carlieri]|uniref:S-layer homology domain-containing protein n=1 Tax=Tissierella carlieri TaxID=689904 RepID=A0ABT1SC18_9FIRM|nr:S-layer homology domain-containing protein [Tissierella carlieri]MCQ4924005.1 S-layer homology domain-containing protein [Tissierella carlieri]
MSKRILSLVLALVMVLGTFGTVFAAETGSDKIDWLVEQGIVKGDASGNLMLDKNIDRASVAKMVVEALGQQAAAAGMQGVKSIFPDVPAGHWSNGNINIVNGLGLMKGNAKGQFMPSAEISYAEVVTILVRMSNGFTAEEEKAAVWPASYIAKANELGILEDITVANFSAAAVRKDILEMFYNAMINMEVGKYSVVKGIVLENYRVQKLDKDKVLVEVIKEIKKADYVEQSRKEQGDQVTLTIPAKVADVENLLGRVADFTVDKDNNVVAMKIDESYKVETGDFKATKNKMGSFTVDLPERYSKNDETIFRTYYNNEAYKYEDFYQNPDEKDRKDEFEVDYAKVTVKNGKVLFIDAFNFEDVAPVKEVKSDGAEVLVYNDIRDGSIKTLKLSSTDKVITFNDGKMGIGSREDIKANDVIHEFDGGFIVRKDASVNGTFKKVSEARNGKVFAHIDDNEYEILNDDYKRPVYSYDSSKDFYTLSAKNADSTLKEFRDEKVTILIDLSGNLQYIGSEIELGEFVGLVTRVVGDQLRVLKTDGKTYDYKANLDTKVFDNSTTGHKGLNTLAKGDLVYMSVDGDIIDRIDKLEATERNIKDLTTRAITLDNNDEFRILDGTNIFVEQDLSVRTAKAVKDAYDEMVKKNKTAKAYVIDGKTFADLRVRRPEANITRATEAHTIVFTQITITPDYKTTVVEYNGFADRYDRQMNVILEDGTKETRSVDKDVKYVDLAGNEVALRGGDIIEIQETKDDNKDIMKVVRLIEKANNKNYFEVSYYNRGDLKVKDATGAESKTYYVDSKAVIFGGNISESSGSRIEAISYVLEDNSDYVKAVLVRGKVEKSKITGMFSTSQEEVTGIVTYLSREEGSESFAVDNKTPYFLNAKTVLTDKNDTVIAMGAKAVANALTTPIDKKGDKVEVTIKGDVMTIKRIALAGDMAAEAALKAAKEAVTKAEGSKLQADVTAAQALVTALPTGADKTALQERLDAVQAIIDGETALAAAERAVLKAELTEAQADVNAAQALVTALPEGADKTALQERLDAVQAIIDAAAVTQELNAAKTAIQGATYTLNNATDNTEAGAKAAVEAVVNGLVEVTGKGFDVTVTGTFTEAEVGTAGSYVFTVKLVKAGQDVTTAQVTAEIPAL